MKVLLLIINQIFLIGICFCQIRDEPHNDDNKTENPYWNVTDPSIYFYGFLSFSKCFYDIQTRFFWKTLT